MLSTIKATIRPGQRVFVGVTDPIDPRVETPEEVRDRVLEAAEFIPLTGSGPPMIAASPRSGTTRPPRATRRSQRSARVEGTALAARQLGA